MKNLFFSLFLLAITFSPLKADHWVGGNISYKYFGAPHVYEVSLVLIREKSGVAVGNTAELFFSSSCFGKDSIFLNIQPGYKIVSDGYCVGGKTIETFEAYTYKGLVNLDGVCSDWVFSFQGCCRHIGISNIDDPYNRPIYLDAHLDNSNGPNNSAVFHNLTNKTFCYSPTGTINFLHSATDSDMDSLHYRFAQPMETAAEPILYKNGFDLNNPISSNPPAKLNKFSGNLSFKPVNIELDIVKIEVEEFRLDLLNNTYVKTGSVNKEILLPVAPFCSDEVMFWELSSLTDSVNKTLKYHCRDTVLRFHTSRKFQSRSLAADGSDFLVIEGLKKKNIKRAKAINEHTIEIHLTDSIKRNGNFFLMVKEGLDSNSIENHCGFQMLMDSLQIKHMGCSEISELENPITQFQFYPNPVSNVLNFNWPFSEKTELSITDLQGKLLTTLLIEKQASFQWDVTWLPKGAYTLHYKNKHGIQTALIVKE